MIDILTAEASFLANVFSIPSFRVLTASRNTLTLKYKNAIKRPSYMKNSKVWGHDFREDTNYTEISLAQIAAIVYNFNKQKQEKLFGEKLRSPIFEIDADSLAQGPVTLNVDPDKLKQLCYYHRNRIKYPGFFIELRLTDDSFDKNWVFMAYIENIDSRPNGETIVNTKFSTTDPSEDGELSLRFVGDQVTVDLLNRKTTTKEIETEFTEENIVTLCNEILGNCSNYYLPNTSRIDIVLNQTVVNPCIYTDVSSISGEDKRCFLDWLIITSRISNLQRDSYTIVLPQINEWKVRSDNLDLYKTILQLQPPDNKRYELIGKIPECQSILAPDNYAHNFLSNCLFLIARIDEYLDQFFLLPTICFEKFYRIIQQNSALTTRFQEIFKQRESLRIGYRTKIFNKLKVFKTLPNISSHDQNLPAFGLEYFSNSDLIRNGKEGDSNPITLKPHLGFRSKLIGLLKEFELWQKEPTRLDSIEEIIQVRENFRSNPGGQSLFNLLLARNKNGESLGSIYSASLLPLIFENISQASSIEKNDNQQEVDAFIQEAANIAVAHQILENGVGEHVHLIPQMSNMQIIAFLNQQLPENFQIKIPEDKSYADWVYSSKKYMRISQYLLLLHYPTINLAGFKLPRMFINTQVMTLHEKFHEIDDKMGFARESQYDEYYTVMSQFVILNTLANSLREKTDELSKLAVKEIESRLEKREIFEFYYTFGIIGLCELLWGNYIKEFTDKQIVVEYSDEVEQKLLEIFNSTVGKFYFQIFKKEYPNSLDDALLMIDDYILYLAQGQHYILKYVVGAHAGKSLDPNFTINNSLNKCYMKFVNMEGESPDGLTDNSVFKCFLNFIYSIIKTSPSFRALNKILFSI